MEFEQSYFDDYLDRTHGDIELGGESFSYAHVYKVMHPEAYAEDYLDWCYEMELNMGEEL